MLGNNRDLLLKPLYNWFGGKWNIAPTVWELLGNVPRYVEPFFGSGAVMFSRVTEPDVETINDIDYWIANFWRAVKNDPEQVAYYADNPINEADLSARHIWLVTKGLPALRERIPADIDYYDAKVAGYWVWGIGIWMGSEWCSGKGKWTISPEGKLVEKTDSSAPGVSRSLPLVGCPQGIHRKSTRDKLPEHLQVLCDRLRYVQVACGDWKRILTPGALAHGGIVGIFLDPPYDLSKRDKRCYNFDSENISAEVRQWCLENYTNPRYRIVLCEYEGEHNVLEEYGWRKIAWKAGRAFPHTNKTVNAVNCNHERIWASPNCLLSTREMQTYLPDLI
jgi:site-specific DNA-adenine methylase